VDTIRQIIEQKRLCIHFQPILSVRGRTFFGVEALIRGIASDGSILTPDWLFREAAKDNLSIELDRLARHMAIEAFFPLWQRNNRLLLFVNFESRLIDSFEIGHYLFDGLLKQHGIPFSNIVLEIKEDEIQDVSKLEIFCDHYRNLGFNIALDDFGVGSSSFDRLGIVRPDIIKIDRSLMSGIDTNYIHQEIVRAITRMSTNIGAIVLAEGIERCEEAGYAQHLGITLIQGFWIARPSTDPVCEDFSTKIDSLKSYCHKLEIDLYTHSEELCYQAETLCTRFEASIAALDDLSNWHYRAKPILHASANVEALYLINASARQIGPTLLQRKTRSFFEPTDDGSDHSRKEYYSRTLDSKSHSHLTGSYVSLATGNLCRTYARKIDIAQTPYVLCIDFVR